MIGSGLKKLAEEYGMTVSGGIAYGSLGGFAATLNEGGGYKRIVFSTRFSDPAGRTGFMDAVNARNVKKEFRVIGLGVDSRTIVVNFQDNPGTMKKIRAFLDWVLPLLRTFGASGVDICPECGMPIDRGRWAMVDGVAHHFHDACAGRVRQAVEEGNEQRSREDTGHYITGLLGALAGSVLGAVVWAIVLSIGYIASIVGLLIGFLAEKGYDLARGKQGKGKVVILIFAVVFGVLLGNLGAEAFTVFSMIQGGELPGIAVGDIPLLIWLVLSEDAEYRGYLIKNVLMGLLFAALGVFALLRQTGKDVSGVKYIDLN
ncbi:MAG: hypothetical protein SPI15_13295 [Candidatus Faecousia sp.]|nr:hypothetical protein [Candidatus Faecousia sp.]